MGRVRCRERKDLFAGMDSRFVFYFFVYWVRLFFSVGSLSGRGDRRNGFELLLGFWIIGFLLRV